jgi:hypothetical protein
MDNVSQGMFELNEGKHYIIDYEEDGEFKRPYIVFAKDARVNEPKNYGMGSKYIIGMDGETGYFSAGEEGEGTIFPVAENRGYLVDQIWVMVSIESPSITVYDPAFNDGAGVDESSLARTIAENLEFVIAPIIVDEPPATIAFSKGNGAEIVDQIPTAADTDPTVTQDFEDTPLEDVLDELSGGPGLNNASFLKRRR